MENLKSFLIDKQWSDTFQKQMKQLFMILENCKVGLERICFKYIINELINLKIKTNKSMYQGASIFVTLK